MQVAHTGDLDATIEACTVVDGCVKVRNSKICCGLSTPDATDLDQAMAQPALQKILLLYVYDVFMLVRRTLL